MSEYDEVIEEAGEVGVLEVRPLRTYRWCGLLERRHDVVICDQIRIKTDIVTRGKCKFLNETGGCDFLTDEEKITRAKARDRKEEEVRENGRQKRDIGDTDVSPGESID